jgi:hypothetical protein
VVIRRIKEFKASSYKVPTAKKLVAEKGILSCPNVKPGKVLHPTTFKIMK